MKTMHLYRNLGVVAVGMMSMLATSCEEDIDNTCLLYTSPSPRD